MTMFMQKYVVVYSFFFLLFSLLKTINEKDGNKGKNTHWAMEVPSFLEKEVSKEEGDQGGSCNVGDGVSLLLLLLQVHGGHCRCC